MHETLAWLPARQQQVFRQLMTAFAYPGRVQTLRCADGEALRLMLATLVDGSCSLADAQQMITSDDWRRLGARTSGIDTADFIVCPGTRMLEGTPRLGSLENPEQGATLVLTVSSLGEGTRLLLQGPGIDGERLLCVAGMHPAWWMQRAEWNTHFPLGVDFILVSAHELAALPRTTCITVQGEH